MAIIPAMSSASGKLLRCTESGRQGGFGLRSCRARLSLRSMLHLLPKSGLLPWSAPPHPLAVTVMKLQLLLLAALVGSALASKGHHVHHISSTSDFEEKTGDGKVRGPDQRAIAHGQRRGLRPRPSGHFRGLWQPGIRLIDLCSSLRRGPARRCHCCQSFRRRIHAAPA